MGSPASSKGSTCQAVTQTFPNIEHVSTGDMLREEVARGTVLGMLAKQQMDSGGLVSDSIINPMLQQKLKSIESCGKGWILDGYPRCEDNHRFMLQFCPPVDLVIHLSCIDDDTLVQRMCGRMVDPETGNIYHETMRPPPCEQIKQRCKCRSTDKDTETARKRIRVYRQEMARQFEWFPQSHHVTIDSRLPLDQVTETVRKLLM
jgi:adenylate kinase